MGVPVSAHEGDTFSGHEEKEATRSSGSPPRRSTTPKKAKATPSPFTGILIGGAGWWEDFEDLPSSGAHRPTIGGRMSCEGIGK